MSEIYVPMSVNFDDHPAILAASIEAEAVYQRALRLSKRLLTDGVICSAHARRLTDDLDGGPYGHGPVGTAVFDELADLGLVVAAGDGWEIVGFLDRNPTRAAVDAQRDAAAERKRRYREKHRETVSDGTRQNVHVDATSRDRLQDKSRQDKSRQDKPSGGVVSDPENLLRSKNAVTNYVSQYRDVHGGKNPPGTFTNQLGRELTNNAGDLDDDELDAVVWVLAHEGKRPSTLLDVLGDYRRSKLAAS